MKDPKQLLLMHVEKIVLAVMVLLLLLVLWVYEPWNVNVTRKSEIAIELKKGQDEMRSSKWDGESLAPPPAFASEINGLRERPWQNGPAPTVQPANKLIFWNLSKKGVWVVRAPDPPPVLPAVAVYAKADRGQVVIVFQIDQAGELRALGNTAVPDYQNGVEFDRVEISRVDRNAPNAKPVLITPKGWLPTGLPVLYGAPAGDVDFGPRGYFGVPVYIYAQAGGNAGDAESKRREEEMRRRMEEDMKHRAEEQAKAEAERRAQEDRIRAGAGKTTTPETRTPRTTPRVPGPRTTAPKAGPRTGSQPGVAEAGAGGWYYFVDQGVDPDGRYEYNVVIYCKNPVYGKYKDTGEVVAEIVKSDPAVTPAGKEIKVEPFKKWFFQGGTSSGQIELGTFKVRSFVGGRREFTPEEIAGIVAELSGTGAKAPASKPKPTKAGEPEGEWVDQSFTVKPGEEIGGKMTVTVAGERREVDFSTGCFLVSVGLDSQVNETHQTVTVPGAGGVVKSEERVNRMVIPKLRCAYMDRRGNLRTKWQEVVPPLPKGTEKAN